MKKLLFLLSFFLLSQSLQAQWLQSNGPCGGQIYSLAVIGTNTFAGTYGSGVFLSTDNGADWTAVSTGLTNKNIEAL
ncbi:regulator, partial [Candidatus Bathyarchaeota archaeon]|nr:regulator [Candidatus Bathyarchaeota archaeon]